MWLARLSLPVWTRVWFFFSLGCSFRFNGGSCLGLGLVVGVFLGLGCGISLQAWVQGLPQEGEAAQGRALVRGSRRSLNRAASGSRLLCRRCCCCGRCRLAEGSAERVQARLSSQWGGRWHPVRDGPVSGVLLWWCRQQPRPERHPWGTFADGLFRGAGTAALRLAAYFGGGFLEVYVALKACISISTTSCSTRVLGLVDIDVSLAQEVEYRCQRNVEVGCYFTDFCFRHIWVWGYCCRLLSASASGCCCGSSSSYSLLRISITSSMVFSSRSVFSMSTSRGCSARSWQSRSRSS